MRNPHNAVSDTIAALGLTESVIDIVRIDPNNPRRWLIRIQSRENALIHSFLEIEVIEEDDGDAAVCVLRRYNVGRGTMTRIMNNLVRQLDDDARLEQPWGQLPSRAAQRDPQH